MAITISGDSPSFASYQGGVLVSGTAVASTSGTSIDFTSIPSWVKRITVMFNGVSTSGTSQVILRLGTSSGIETSGYLGNTAQLSDASSSVNYSHASNNGIVTDGGANSAGVRQGAIFISLLNASTNTWASSGSIGRSDISSCSTLGGVKPLAATLDRVRITTVNGTDTFDAGTINILYE
jgi:hypothetical protein